VGLASPHHTEVLDLLERLRTARTVEGHHCAPLCEVGVPLALRSRAIWASVLPAACSAQMRSRTSRGTAAGRPGGADGALDALGGRRRSSTSRSSSSAGISRAPHGVSTVSTYGRTRRLKVEGLTPSASAAWVRV